MGRLALGMEIPIECAWAATCSESSSDVYGSYAGIRVDTLVSICGVIDCSIGRYMVNYLFGNGESICSPTKANNIYLLLPRFLPPRTTLEVVLFMAWSKAEAQIITPWRTEATPSYPARGPGRPQRHVES